MLLGTGPVLAQPFEGRSALGPRGACLHAAQAAERNYAIPQGLLVAMAVSESGLHAYALSISGRAHFPNDLATARRLLAGGRGRSVMAGCMQVNAGVHARGQEWPLDPVRSSDWAAAELRRHYDSTGTWANALRRWHGGTPSSDQRVVCRVRGTMQATAPGSGLFGRERCGAAETARLGDESFDLIELAEAPGS